MSWKSNSRKNPAWKLRPTVRERMDEELAAHYATEHFPVVPDTWNMGKVHEYITEHAHAFHVIDYIYVVNASKKLVGVLSLRDLFSRPKKMDVRHAMERKIISASPEMHKEHLAKLALQHHLRAIPIVENGKFEGVILTNGILRLINRSLHEKLLIFSGVHPSHLDYDDTMKVPLVQSIQHRAPWLVIGLVGVMIAAGVINHYEHLLNKHLILAFFIPAILYMSNALGIQNQTLLIRDLATMGNKLKIMPYFLKTMAIGGIMSVLLGGLVYILTLLIWKNPATASVIAIAMAATLLISAFTSIATTLLFRKLGQDPAFGSGPFATIISDVTSILVYFLIVSMLL